MAARAVGVPAVRGGVGRAGYAAGVLALMLLAASLRGDFTGSDVPGVVFSRSDERHYVELATNFLNGRWRVEYFVNPTFYAYVLYGASALVGRALTLVGPYDSYADFVSDATRSTYVITLVGRSLGFAFAVASVPLLYRAGRRFASPAVGLVAAAALSVNRVHVSRSALVGNETLLVLLVLSFFLAVLRYLDAPSARRHAACGILLGLATSTKYTGGLHAVTFLVATLLAARASRRTGSSWPRELLRARHAIGFPLAAIAFFAASPFVLLDWPGFVQEFAFLASFHQGDHGNIATSGWVYYPLAYAQGEGVAFAVLGGLGLVWALYRSVVRGDGRGWLLLAATAPAYAFLGSADYKLARYLLVAIPFLSVAGAWVLETLGVRLAGVLPRRAPAAPQAAGQGIALALGVVLLLPHGLATQQLAASRGARLDPRAELLDWLYARLDIEEPLLDFCYGARCRFFAEPGPAPEADVPKVRFGPGLFRSTPLQRVLASRPDLRSFRERLGRGPEKRLVCSFWSDPLPASAQPRPTYRTLFHILARNSGFGERFPYWEDARPLLEELEIADWAIAANRRYAIFVLELP